MYPVRTLVPLHTTLSVWHGVATRDWVIIWCRKADILPLSSLSSSPSIDVLFDALSHSSFVCGGILFCCQSVSLYASFSSHTHLTEHPGVGRFDFLFGMLAPPTTTPARPAVTTPPRGGGGESENINNHDEMITRARRLVCARRETCAPLFDLQVFIFWCWFVVPRGKGKQEQERGSSVGRWHLLKI